MRRNNTLSWRWDYLSTCPAHCPKILFSLLIARIQRLAQDDPIYQHNLLFSLLQPLNSLWRGWCQKLKKWWGSYGILTWTVNNLVRITLHVHFFFFFFKYDAWILKQNSLLSQFKRFFKKLLAKIILFNMIHGIFLSRLKCRSFNKSTSFSKGSDVLRKRIWIKQLIIEEPCQHQSLQYSLLIWFK